MRQTPLMTDEASPAKTRSTDVFGGLGRYIQSPFHGLATVGRWFGYGRGGLGTSEWARPARLLGLYCVELDNGRLRGGCEFLGLEDFIPLLKGIEESLGRNVYDVPRRIVRHGVAKHEPNVGRYIRTGLVHHSVKTGLDCAKIHRVLDDLVVVGKTKGNGVDGAVEQTAAVVGRVRHQPSDDLSHGVQFGLESDRTGMYGHESGMVQWIGEWEARRHCPGYRRLGFDRRWCCFFECRSQRQSVGRGRGRRGRKR